MCVHPEVWRVWQLIAKISTISTKDSSTRCSITLFLLVIQCFHGNQKLCHLVWMKHVAINKQLTMPMVLFPVGLPSIHLRAWRDTVTSEPISLTWRRTTGCTTLRLSPLRPFTDYSEQVLNCRVEPGNGSV